MSWFICNSCGSENHAGGRCPITGKHNDPEIWAKETVFDGVLLNGKPLTIYEIENFDFERD